MTQWLIDLSNWFFDLFVALWDALKHMVYDFAVWVFGGVLVANWAVLSVIPAPSFLTSYSISSLIASMGPCPIAYLDAIGLTTGFTIIASGFGFLMVRKFITLFQW